MNFTINPGFCHIYFSLNLSWISDFVYNHITVFYEKLLILNKYKTSNWKMQSPFSLIMWGICSSGSENRKKKVKNHQEMSHVQMLAYFYKHMWDLFKYVIFHSASFCLIDYKHLWTSLCQLPWQEATTPSEENGSNWWQMQIWLWFVTVEIPFPSSLGNTAWVSSTPSSSLSKNKVRWWDEQFVIWHLLLERQSMEKLCGDAINCNSFTL